MPPLSRMLAFALAHPRWLAPLLGAAAACGFQPLALWPLTLLALAGLMELIARAPRWRDAAVIGWLFGVGHFTVGDNWIATAFTYQANMPAWLGAIAVVLLSLYLAVYPMLGVTGAWLVARCDRSRLPLVLAFAGCWIISEMAARLGVHRLRLEPARDGSARTFSRPGLAALAPVMGTYALSGLTVLLAGCWLLAAARGRRDLPGFGLYMLPVLAILMPSLALDPTEGALRFTLVQPDIRQNDLNDPRQWESQFVKLAGLTLPRQPGAKRLVLWPESGVPDYLRDGYPRDLYEETTYRASPMLARQRIGRVIGPGSLLLTGAIDLEFGGVAAVAARNVVSPITADGAIMPGYAKAHLVPYGEYLPMRWLLEPLGASRAGRRHAGFPARSRAADDRPRSLGQSRHADLLRDRLLGRSRRPVAPTRLYLQPFERRVVRRLGSAAAPGPGADARDRGRPAGTACDDHRHQRGDRPPTASCGSSFRATSRGSSTASYRLRIARPCSHGWATRCRLAGR